MPLKGFKTVSLSEKLRDELQLEASKLDKTLPSFIGYLLEIYKASKVIREAP